MPLSLPQHGFEWWLAESGDPKKDHKFCSEALRYGYPVSFRLFQFMCQIPISSCSSSACPLNGIRTGQGGSQSVEGKRDKIPVLEGAGLRYANSYSSTRRRVSRSPRGSN